MNISVHMVQAISRDPDMHRKVTLYFLFIFSSCMTLCKELLLFVERKIKIIFSFFGNEKNKTEIATPKSIFFQWVFNPLKHHLVHNIAELI